MAIDLNALQKRLAQLSGQNTKKTSSWRPVEGTESTVRIISFPNNDGQPFKERWFYYGIGNNSGLLTPNQFGKPDPIQELITQLRSNENKESYELAKKLYPKMRCYAAVVVRGEEDKGVRLWAFGKTVYQDLIKLMLDSDYGDITDPDNGFDIKVSCTKPAGGKMYAETSLRPRPKSSKLSDDRTQVKSWLDSVPNLDDIYSCKNYTELKNILNAWLEDPDASEGTEKGGSESASSKDDSDEKDSAPVPQQVVKKTPQKQKTETKPVSDVSKSLDDAFAELDGY